MADDLSILIGKSGKQEFNVSAQELVTGRTCVIAQSGAGKSYLIGLICEKLLENSIGFCIIDTEGEYFSLKEKFSIFWVGGENADAQLDKVDFKQLAKKAIRDNIPIILDVSDSLDEKKDVEEFSSALYDAATEMRSPYLMIIEEADKFVPQNKDSIKKLEEISRRGRKRGLGMLLASQRPALINKNVLSQCGNQLIGKLTTENDLQAVNLFFGDRKELEELPKLQPGEFFVMGNISKIKTKIKTGERVTKHKGFTPKLIPKALGQMSDIKEDVVKEFELPEEKTAVVKHSRAMKLEVDKDAANAIVEKKRKKKFMIFGQKERVTKISLAYIPMIYVEIKMPEGIIKKSYKPHSFIIDGVNGKMADVSDGLSYNDGFSDMIGLSEGEIRALIEIVRDSRGLTASEIGMKTGLSESSVRSILTQLQNKRIITYAGKVRDPSLTSL